MRGNLFLIGKVLTICMNCIDFLGPATTFPFLIGKVLTSKVRVKSGNIDSQWTFPFLIGKVLTIAMCSYTPLKMVALVKRFHSL